MYAHKDTIVAQATASGRGGIAIVRVSGEKVSSIIQSVLKSQLKPRQTYHLPFLDHDETVIDEGVAVYFQAPNSFTGEDVLELHGHGSPVVVDSLIQRILSLGARMANPGEFSERAFLNDKIDLTQAEAIADLIDAQSKQAARLAVRSLQGAFSRAIASLSEKIIYLRTYIEAAIDFAEEEIDFLKDDQITKQYQAILDELSTIQSQAKQGSLMREGITAVIAGEPNVGKSSLLNALSGKELAIVTDIPGTTRDVLRDHVLVHGIPMHIIDTAGLRDSDDVVEREGIRRAKLEMDQADLILHVQDANQADAASISSYVPTLVIKNKIDLAHTQPAVKQENETTQIYLSAKTGAGIDLLRATIVKTVGAKPQEEGLYSARRRHLDALARAKVFLEQGLTQLTDTRAGELVAEELRLAHQSLCEITGEFSADDLLGRIFASFCVGK